MKNLFLLLFCLYLPNNIQAQQKSVYIVHIESEIDLGMSPYVSRVIDEAEKAEADAIVFIINTLGGRVDAAIEIKDKIISTSLPTIAFVKNRAISAGALIALSCQKIFISQGSSIGAATVVNQSGEKVGEKYQSFMRSEMRAVAEKNSRPVNIAQGMVDEKIVVDGLVDSTRLITLTTDEAIKYKIADGEVSSLEKLLVANNLNGAKIVESKFNWAEEVVKFLNNPIMSSILLMIGFFGILAEIKSPGWGLPGTAGLIALTLFFGSSYILNIASALEIFIFIVGIVLLLLEVFVIPGFGVAGILGIIFVVGSLFFSLLPDLSYVSASDISFAIIQFSISLVVSVIGLFLLAKYLPKSRVFQKFILSESETTEGGFVSSKADNLLVGKEGVSLTILRPSGIAEIDGKRVDVVSTGEFIEPQVKIKIIKIEGSKIVVERIK